MWLWRIYRLEAKGRAGPPEWFGDFVTDEFLRWAHQKRILGKNACAAIIDTGSFRHYIPEEMDNSIELIPKSQIYERWIEDISTERRPRNRLNYTAEKEVGGLHGTLVTGIVNLIAPKASLLDIKAGTANIVTDEGPFLKALNDCIEMHKTTKERYPDVINISMGTYKPFSFCNGNCESAQLVDKASHEGILVVAAAGNKGAGTIACPGCAKSALTVGSTIKREESIVISPTSSYVNRKPDVVAPSGLPTTTISSIDVFPTLKFMSYRVLFGTSFAAPIVTGLALLLLGIKKDVDDVKRSILETAGEIEDVANSAQGYGQVRPRKAITSLLGRKI